MTKWKIGLVVLGLVSAVGCGDSGSADEGNTTGATAGDDGGGSTGNTTGGPRVDAGGGSTGGTSAGGTTAGATTGGTDAGGTTGVAGTGACTNAADKAIIDGLSQEKAACISAGCAVDSISGFSIDEAKLAMCVAGKPELSKLSGGCQKCFVDISLCVPNKCTLLGGNAKCNDAMKPDCNNPKAPAADCLKCQQDMCQPAFAKCTGLTF